MEKLLLYILCVPCSYQLFLGNHYEGLCIQYIQYVYEDQVIACPVAVPYFPYTGEWSFTEPGFTGIAIVAEAQMGTTHGVYVLEDPEGISRKYKEGGIISSFLSLHKLDSK